MSDEIVTNNLPFRRNTGQLTSQIVFGFVNESIHVIVRLKRMKTPLNIVSFPTKKVESGLDWLTIHAIYNSNTRIKITGNRIQKQKKKITDLLQDKFKPDNPPVYIDFEESSQIGIHEILLHSDINNFLYHVEYKPCIKKSPLKGFDMMLHRRRKSFDESREKFSTDVSHTSNFPVLVCFTDFDYIKLVRLEESEKSRTVWTSLSFPGNSLLGFASTILGVKSLEELDELSMKGEKHKLDLHLSDVVPLDKDNVFMNSSLDMAMFAFGRISHFELNRDSCKKEDIAKSLMFLMTASLCHEIFMKGIYEGISLVYLCGKLASMKSFQEECEDFLSFWSGDIIRFRYLDASQASVLGAISP